LSKKNKTQYRHPLDENTQFTEQSTDATKKKSHYTDCQPKYSQSQTCTFYALEMRNSS